MGQCMDIDVDVLEDARGCAHELETHMISKVRQRIPERDNEYTGTA